MIEPRLTLPGVEVYIGDAKETVLKLAEKYGGKVNMVCTSPPYFNLRDYGTAAWDGGDPACDHGIKRQHGSAKVVAVAQSGHVSAADKLNRKICAKCGAIRVDRQIGIEDTVEEYVNRLCDLFDAIGDNLLTAAGSLWINLGDSYSGSGGAGGDYNEGGIREGQPKWKPPKSDFPAKCLQMVPERFALEMIRRGWILRNKVIWFKGRDTDEPLDEEEGGAPTSNGMPVSADDRLKGTYEVVFHFVRAQRYFYQLDEIREPHDPESIARTNRGRTVEYDPGHPGSLQSIAQPGGMENACHPLGRNPGDVWAIPTSPFPLAHFATFPPALCHRPAKATLPVAVCVNCGAPMTLATRTEYVNPGNRTTNGPRSTERRHETPGFKVRLEKRVYVEGYKPTCDCNAGWTGGIAMDPFMGSGSTAQGVFEARPPVTIDGCYCQPLVIGIDLDERNLEIIEKRLTGRARQKRKTDLKPYAGGLLELLKESATSEEGESPCPIHAIPDP